MRVRDFLISAPVKLGLPGAPGVVEKSRDRCRYRGLNLFLRSAGDKQHGNL
jgi:hypothetical protein